MNGGKSLPPGIREHHGKYQVRFRKPNGKEASQHFRRLSDAKAFKAAVETDKRRGLWSDPRLGRITFARMSEEWLETTIHLRPKTLYGYHSLLRSRLLPEFGSTPLARITTPQVKSFVAHLTEIGLSASRVRQAYQLLSMILKAAVESGYLPKTPCVGVRVPRTPSRKHLILEPEQIDALAETIRDPYGVLVYVLGFGGLRWGEAAALTRERCDILGSRLEIARSLAEVNGQLIFGEPKTSARRYARLPRFVSEMLGEHLGAHTRNPDDLVFQSPGKTPLRYSNFRRRVWRPALDELGPVLPSGLTPHHLRHTCASTLVRNGASIKAVQVQLGHSTPIVTLNTYTHLFGDDLDHLFDNVEGERRASDADLTRTKTPRLSGARLRNPL